MKSTLAKQRYMKLTIQGSGCLSTVCLHMLNNTKERPCEGENAYEQNMFHKFLVLVKLVK